MDRVSTAVLDAGRGLRGSANYDGRRHVTIIAAERWTELVAELGSDIDPIVRRANILVSGVDLENSGGRELIIGPCRLRIDGETRPCERMEEAFSGLQAAMRNRWGGGAWAEVLTSGEIAVGDPVAWQATQPLFR